MSLDTAIQSLVSRLEQVTSRLERVEKQLGSGAGAGAGAAPAAAHADAGGDGASSASVQDYDALVAEHVKPLVDASNKFGSELAKQVTLVDQAVQAQRALLVTAAQSKKPSDADFQKLLKPTADLINQIIEVKSKAPRNSTQINHLNAIAEGIQGLGWVTISPAPAPFVKEAGQSAAEFHTNRVLKEFKGKDQAHVDWVHHWIGFLAGLQPYIKKHHTTGLAWTGTGVAGAAPAPAAPGAPKLPPPPPSGASLAAAAASSHAPAPAAAHAAKDADPSALLAQLNRGLDVTSGLRKVKPEEKTKNRKPEEKSSVVKADDIKPAKGAKAAAGAKSAIGVQAGKPVRLELEGNKWVIENQQGPKEIEIKETEPKQTVYIYHCSNVVVKISGKINAITVDACGKVGVVFENAISSVETVNSHSVQVQVLGKVPSFAIDKCSGFNLYLSKDCLDAEIISSKSDAMNVVLPPAKEGEDVTEIPIPEQFKTVVKDRKLVTDSVRHE